MHAVSNQCWKACSNSVRTFKYTFLKYQMYFSEIECESFVILSEPGGIYALGVYSVSLLELWKYGLKYSMFSTFAAYFCQR